MKLNLILPLIKSLRILVLGTLMLICPQSWSQVLTCAANFYDSGGVGDYSNDENNTVTYCPDSPDKCIVVTFNVFDVECTNPGCTVCKDKLFIYDGRSEEH